jgi:hypothetical protein
MVADGAMQLVAQHDIADLRFPVCFAQALKRWPDHDEAPLTVKTAQFAAVDLADFGRDALAKPMLSRLRLLAHLVSQRQTALRRQTRRLVNCEALAPHRQDTVACKRDDVSTMIMNNVGK